MEMDRNKKYDERYVWIELTKLCTEMKMNPLGAIETIKKSFIKFDKWFEEGVLTKNKTTMIGVLDVLSDVAVELRRNECGNSIN